MAYIAPADLRSATLAEYAAGLALSTTEVSNAGSEALLTATITRVSALFDAWTNDHFAPWDETSYSLNPIGGPTLVLPHRTTAIYRLFTVDEEGNTTLEDDAAYRLSSSLDASGAIRLKEFDYLEVIPGGVGLSGTEVSPWAFDAGTGTVQIDATFGWTATPGDVKRAISLLVYDHWKPIAADLRRSDRWSTSEASFTRSATEPSGIPEVDAIIAQYRRESLLGVG